MGIKRIPLPVFLITLIAYVIASVYLLYISYTSPVIGLTITKNDGHWIITNFDFPDWAKTVDIKKGDILLTVNDVPVSQLDHRTEVIRTAASLSTSDQNGKLHMINITYHELPYSFFYYFLLPFIYSVAILCIVILLYRVHLTNFASLNILLYFLLTVAITYASVSALIQQNPIGVIINSTGMITCLVLLIHFLKFYFDFLQLELPHIKKMIWYYFIPLLIFLLMILSFVIPTIHDVNTYIILITFMTLLLSIIYILLTSYYIYRKKQIMIIFWGIIFPFIPFFALYVLPMLLFHTEWINPIISIVFILIIPFFFIFLQFVQRLYHISYHISKLRYYTFFTFFTSIWLVSGVYFLTKPSLQRIIMMGIFFFLSLLLLFYMKEKIDYMNRKMIFSPKGDYIHLLYTTIELISKEATIHSLLKKIADQFLHIVKADAVACIKYDMALHKTELILTEPTNYALEVDLTPSLAKGLKIGEIIKQKDGYVFCIHQNLTIKYFIRLNCRQRGNLKKEELLWIELLVIYMNQSIENTQMIQEILEELQKFKTKNTIPKWLEKLMWIEFEHEKSQLSQELHDTILQEQIFLIRKIDQLSYEKNPVILNKEIHKLHQQLIHVNKKLRQYCECLKPPLFNTLGLETALNRLFKQVEERSTFTLIRMIKSIELTDAHLELLIYRLIQEMLNNALKHSNATYVKIELHPYNKGFHLFYMDNGVGFDLTTIKKKSSFGLLGMKERVAAFNGELIIDTYPGEGVQIDVRIDKGDDNDYDSNFDN